ncbi:MAG: DUF433 domain-containing protein [Dehalococcoidia bacterium]
MQLEEYFDFLDANDIRIRGHRIGIETILDEYLDAGRRPEEIQTSFPTLSLEEVYATILYYLRNREQIDAYLQAGIEHEQRMIAEQERNPPPGLVKLRERLRQRAETGNPIA